MHNLTFICKFMEESFVQPQCLPQKISALKFSIECKGLHSEWIDALIWVWWFSFFAKFKAMVSALPCPSQCIKAPLQCLQPGGNWSVPPLLWFLCPLWHRECPSFFWITCFLLPTPRSGMLAQEWHPSDSFSNSPMVDCLICSGDSFSLRSRY